MSGDPEDRWEPFALSDEGEALALENLLADLAEWREECGAPVVLERERGGEAYRIRGDEVVPVEISTVEIDEEFYGEEEAVAVEAVIGPLEEDEDTEELLRFADAELVCARLGLGERGGREVLIVEAALPFSRLTLELLDLMIREVASIAGELREEDEE